MSEENQTYCSQIAQDNQLSLIGTATQGKVWFLLEYTAAWAGKAVPAAEIPDEVKEHLTSAVEGERILLIRKAGKSKEKGLSFFIGITDTQAPALYEYQINEYADLLEIDLSFLAAGEPGAPAHLRNEPLFLACVNGKRDLCCAKFGMEVFRAIAEVDPEAVWQSSHIGGHNKAPVTLFFPHGVNYGMTSPDDIQTLIAEYRQGRVGLDFYRGRVGYDNPLQAAEYFWRQQTGIMDLPGMAVFSEEVLGENEWRIGVQGVDGDYQMQFHIRKEVSDVEIPMTCSFKKVEKISRFYLV